MEAPYDRSRVAPVARKSSSLSSHDNEKAIDHDTEVAKEVAHDQAELDEADARQHTIYTKLRPYILVGLALVILGWWISATVLETTRHRWYVSSRSPHVLLFLNLHFRIVQTFWAWFFIM